MRISRHGSGRAFVATMQWLCIFGAICVAHYLVRGVADDLGRPAHSPRSIDSAVFGEPPVYWLQHLIPDSGGVRLLVIALYASWFVGLIALQATVLARAGTRSLMHLVALHAAVLIAADAVFILLPTRPPWMELDVARVIAGAGAQGSSIPDNNALAAVPSLHVAMPFLYALWFARHRDAWLRRLAPAIGVWTLAITFAITYGAEHYVTDAVAGVLCATGVYFGATLVPPALAWPYRRARGRAPQPAIAPEAAMRA